MIYQISSIEFGLGLSIFAVFQAFIFWGFKAWIVTSIKHEYDKKLEVFKGGQLRREKAAIIAEFVAEWTHVKDRDAKRLNQLLWELTLYLPSWLVKEVNAVVSKASAEKSAPDLIVAARAHLLDGEDPLKTADVYRFEVPENKSMVSG